MCRSLAAHMQISIEWKLYTISSKREFKLQITIQHSLDICIYICFSIPIQLPPISYCKQSIQHFFISSIRLKTKTQKKQCTHLRNARAHRKEKTRKKQMNLKQYLCLRKWQRDSMLRVRRVDGVDR